MAYSKLTVKRDCNRTSACFRIILITKCAGSSSLDYNRICISHAYYTSLHAVSFTWSP